MPRTTTAQARQFVRKITADRLAHPDSLTPLEKAMVELAEQPDDGQPLPGYDPSRANDAQVPAGGATSKIQADPWAIRGPAMWAELHGKTNPDQTWLSNFTQRIGCGECKEHWIALLKNSPPDFGDGWFAWTVAAHNAVNQRLGKPIVTIEQATTLYRK